MYTSRRLKDSDFKEEKIIPENLFTIFPKIETIQCDEKTLIYSNKEHFKKVTFIDLEMNTDKELQLQYEKGIQKLIPLSIRKKVKTIKIPNNCQFDEKKSVIEIYPNCKRITTKDCSISNILGQKKDIHLDKFIVLSEGYSTEFDELKGFKNIKEKILLTNQLTCLDIDNEDSEVEMEEKNTENEQEIMKKIKNVFTDVYYLRMEQYDPSIEFDLDLNMKEIDLYEFEKTTNKYYNYIHIKSLDLRKFKQLERITLGKNDSQVMIEGLTNIKELGIMTGDPMYDIEDIPSSVTKVIFSANYCDVRHRFDYSKYPNIKAVEIRLINDFEYIEWEIFSFFYHQMIFN